MFNLFSNIKSILNKSNDEMVLNKHIRFDEDTDDESNMNTQLSKNEIKNETLNLNLVKIRSKREKSFGFELKGDSKKNGEHFIDSVQDDSPSGRVGMQKYDKILKVNGIDVSNMKVNDLIDLLEYETELNDNKLNLTISRQITSNDSNDSISSKRSIDSHDGKIGKKSRLEDKFDSFDPSSIDEINKSRALDQLREIQIEQIKFVASYRVCKKPHVVSKPVLNMHAREIQIKLSSQGKYVNWAEIIYELLKSNNCEHIGELGLSQADNLEVISELIRVQRRIDNIIISSEVNIPFINFLDLEQYIVTDYNHNASKFNLQKIRFFEDLHVGPLIKNQIIRRLFQIEDHIKNKNQLKLITGAELLKQLVSYLRNYDLWSTKIKQNEFEEYLVKKLKVDNFNQFGVKLINLGIIIGALKTVNHLYSENLKQVRNELEIEIGEFYKNEKIYLLKKLDQFSSNYRYLQSEPIDVVSDMLKLFEYLLDRNDYYYMNDFINALKKSEYLCDCFHLAISLGRHEINDSLNKIENVVSGNKKTENYRKYRPLLKRMFFLVLDKTINNKFEMKRCLNKYLREKGLKVINLDHKKFSESETESETEPKPDTQSEESFDKKLQEFLISKFEKNSTVSFDNLIKIESHIYGENRQGLMKLIDRNKALFDQLGLRIGIDKNPDDNRIKKETVLNYINQLRNGLGTDMFNRNIKDLLRSRFVDHEINNLDELIQESESYNQNYVISIDSVLEPLPVQCTDFEVLIEKISSCPVLENLYEYLNWKEQARFYGDFNEFLINLNKKGISIRVLEINAFIFIKLDIDSSIESLKSSIENFDPKRAGAQLVSLICLKYKSIILCPKSLIANEIRSSLSIIRKNKDILKFIIEFILSIPANILPQLLFKFIIEPLTETCSDHEITKKIFNKLTVDYDQDKIEFFSKIGKLMSIEDWCIDKVEIVSKMLKIDTMEVFEEPEIKKQTTRIQKSESLNEVELETFETKIERCQKNIITTVDKGKEYEHIQSIRKRYGIGLDLNEETKSVTESLSGVIGRSLQSLSNELYNKDMHFVLELIQNADDNSYANNVTPTLVFLVENNCIKLFNNEIGFSCRNIDAICDVKASTKGRHQRGYIGRKGIGFKSVFTITDRPEVHSNGYHIKFDLSNGHIGYILPEWVEKYEQELSLNKFNLIDFNTCIKLPLKSYDEMNLHKTSLLTNNFNDIKPNLLLFLNRLRRLLIFNSNGENLIYERQDRDENLVEILNQGEPEHKWFVVKESLQVPEALRPAEHVESTELCLAFPIDNFDNLKKMEVFAYLPLRSFGFKFIIQADFVVPASRQDINHDNEWNQWIAKQIPALFVKTLNEFKKHSFFSKQNINYLNAYLKYIPNEDEIVGFFQHIPREIFDLLKHEDFLPVEGSIDFKKPFECVLADGYIKQVLSADMLKKHAGKYFLKEDISIEKKILRQLGVQLLGMNELIEILEQVFMSEQNLTESKSVAKWLLVMYHCLNGSHSLQQEEKFIKKIKSLKIIPVKKFDYEKDDYGNEFVSLEESVVFFPNQQSDSTSVSEILYKDLLVLDTDQIMCLDPAKNSQIKQFLKHLGIKSLEDPHEIINGHIIKNITDSKLKKPESILVTYLIYIFKNSNNVSFNYKLLSENLPIKTNKGFLKSQKFTIYLTPAYGSRYDFKKSLPSYDWTLIDDEYLRESNSKKSVQNWKNFLINLNLCETFTPECVESVYCKDKNLIAKDFTCKVISFYADFSDKVEYLTDDLIKEFKYLNRLIAETWDVNFSTFKFSSLYENDLDFKISRIHQENFKESSLYLRLKTSKWILAEISNTHELLEPNKVFLKEKNYLSLYSNTVPYISEYICKENTSFYKDLGFKLEFKIEDFVQEFKNWTSQSKKFTTNFAQMKNVYSLISNNLDIMQEILDENFIFVPDQCEDEEDKTVTGRFYTKNQVVWTDKTECFHKYNPNNCPIFISEFYSKSKKLTETFLFDFNVSECPSLQDFVNLLSQISLMSITNKLPASFSEALNDVFSIYELLSETFSSQDLNQVFQDNTILPCFKNKWVSLKQNPVFVDNDFELAEKFSDKIPILITNTCTTDFISQCSIDLNNKKLHHFFINILNIDIFSRLVTLEMENVTTNLRQNEDIGSICAHVLPFIQSFVYHRTEFKSMLEREGSKLKEKLSCLKFYSVRELENIYRFKNDKNICVCVSNKTCWDTKHTCSYYVRYDCVNNIKEVIKGFIKLFTQGYVNEKIERELLNFCLLMNQFREYGLDDRREIERDFKISLELPNRVEKWSIDISEDGEIENESVELKSYEFYKGQSKREKMSILDQISSRQINLCEREFTVLDNTIDCLDRNLDQLEDKMRRNFSIKNLHESEKLVTSEISSVDLVLPTTNFSKKGRDYITKIGRLGELWVNEMLKHKFKSEIEKGTIRVEWVNEHTETGLPYDFRLVYFRSDGDNERFIEVKSTTKMSKEYFPISYKELLFAEKNANKFEIYRLFNIACDDPNNVKLKVVRNVPDLLNTHGINLFIVI